MEILLFKNVWKMKEESLNELLFWNRCIRSRKKRKTKMKSYLEGGNVEFSILKKEQIGKIFRKRIIIKEIIDLRVGCDLQLEKKKCKAKIKWKGKSSEKAPEIINEKYFEISDKYLRKFELNKELNQYEKHEER
jgi:hypothetical protein